MKLHVALTVAETLQAAACPASVVQWPLAADQLAAVGAQVKAQQVSHPMTGRGAGNAQSGDSGIPPPPARAIVGFSVCAQRTPKRVML